MMFQKRKLTKTPFSRFDLRLRHSRLLLGALIIALLGGASGSYFLFRSQAASGISVQANVWSVTPSGPIEPGDSYTQQWHFGVSNFGDLNSELPFTTKWTATPQVNTVNVSPASGQFVTDADFFNNGSQSRDVYITAKATGGCSTGVSINMSLYGKSGALLTTYSAGIGYGVVGTNCGGAPDTPANTNPGGSGGNGGNGSGGNGTGNDGNGTGTNGNGQGQGSGNNGNTPNGSDGSSTSSKTGKSAQNTSNTKAAGGSTKQTDKDGSVPSSTSQGGKQTPNNLQPSPFYDGKQYKPGSDKDKGIKGVISKAGRGIVRSLPYMGGALLLTGLGIWWWIRRRNVA